MVYILEGTHGVGKTERSTTFGVPVANIRNDTRARNITQVTSLLNSYINIDAVFDRFFMLSFPGEDHDKRVSQCIAINNYLKTRSDVTCILYICDREVAWQRYQNTEHPIERRVDRAGFDAAYNWYQEIIPYMDAFQIIDTTNASSHHSG